MSMLARYERGADNLRSSGTASAQPPGPQPKQRRAARKACEQVMSRAERGRDEVLEDGMAGSRAPKARELSVLPPGDGNADWLWIRDAVGRGGRFAFLARPVVAHCPRTSAPTAGECCRPRQRRCCSTSRASARSSPPSSGRKGSSGTSTIDADAATRCAASSTSRSASTALICLSNSSSRSSSRRTCAFR